MTFYQQFSLIRWASGGLVVGCVASAVLKVHNPNLVKASWTDLLLTLVVYIVLFIARCL